MFDNLMGLYNNSFNDTKEQAMIRHTVFEMFRDGFLTKDQYEVFCEMVY